MRFREREVVRITADTAPGGPPKGTEGVVDSFSDRPRGVFVRVEAEAAAGQALWFFTEEELEETGLIEVDARTRERAPFERRVPPAENERRSRSARR